MPEEQHEEAEKNIEIHLGGGGDGDSIPPTDPKAQRLRSWANIIATSTALLTAAIAVIKPQDQTVAKNSYEQLKTSIEQTNEAVKQNHEDMVALHNYLQGYFAGAPAFAPPPISSSAPIPPPPPPPATVSKKPPPAPAATTTITFNTAPASMATVLAYAPAAPSPAFPLPPVSSAAPPPTPPSFDSVAAKK
jgi:hypothetical protein